MRLIDADAFWKSLEISFDEWAKGRTIKAFLDETPTAAAEPVRHAEWIPCVINGKETKLFMTCSGCRRYQWPRSEVPLFRRCPKCGAKMDGGKSDEHAKED